MWTTDLCYHPILRREMSISGCTSISRLHAERTSLYYLDPRFMLSSLTPFAYGLCQQHYIPVLCMFSIRCHYPPLDRSVPLHLHTSASNIPTISSTLFSHHSICWHDTPK
ncbi:hypothetical protein VTN00DRAFT_126 [Thermoascus crustaceus]|uniref:uncharacterized protein n=1 Tax=Thermoascus crustaceus TaxID=5088 RepID=UPI0037443EAF